MYNFLDLILISIIILAIIAMLWYASMPNNLPPGPLGLPIVGCLFKIRPPTAHLTLEKWSKKYGPVFSFYHGKQLVLVLSNLEVMQEALLRYADLAFHGKMRLLSLKNRPPKLGILQSEGPRWKEQRRFALSTLRDFGFGRAILEPKIALEIHDLLRYMEEYNGESFDPQELLSSAISNVISSMIFGRRFEKGSKVKDYLDGISYRISRSQINNLSPLGPYPWLRYVMRPFTDKIERFLEGGEQLVLFMKEEISWARKNYDPLNEPDCLVHAFDKAKLAGEGEYFDDVQLMAMITDLFLAGSDTTMTTLRWALYYMAQYPDIQEKVHKEIVEYFGSAEFPSYSDHIKLPYAEATLLEIQRLSTLLPLSVPHRTIDDVRFLGYNIPKDTMIIPFIWAVHYNSDTFPSPNRFDPNRFLDDNGGIKKNAHIIPFSVGKRICLGESLARMELYMFFTAMIQRFKFSFNPNDTVNHTPFVGFLRSPAKYFIRAQKRK